jgi:hypothetical protein
MLLGYVLPNDDEENERLDMHHALITTAMGDKLFFAPIGKSPQRVLDIATGTGIWAMDFGTMSLCGMANFANALEADSFPTAEVARFSATTSNSQLTRLGSRQRPKSDTTDIVRNGVHQLAQS